MVLDNLFRLRIVNVLVQKRAAWPLCSAEYTTTGRHSHENGAVRQHVSELEGRVNVTHQHKYDALRLSGIDQSANCENVTPESGRGSNRQPNIA